MSRPPIGNRAALASRLRDLRDKHWPGRPVKQRELAAALGIRDSNISNWESSTGTSVPTVSRLADIATFFATTRTLTTEPPRLLTPDLTAEEQSARDRLLTELTELHAVAMGSTPEPRPWHPWRFPDGARIRLVCGHQPEEGRSAYAAEENHNYMALAHYADLDALVELYGHLRAENPRSDVQYRLATDLTREDLQAELIVLGNLAWFDEWELDLTQAHLPVRQVRVDGLDGEPFEIQTSPTEPPLRVRPRFADGRGGRLVEDVGLFVRRPSPLNGNRSLTWCSGVFTRGVVGATRLLVDPELGPANLEWLSGRFRHARTYGVLVRVRLPRGLVMTPDLSDPRSRIFAFTGGADGLRLITE